MFVAECTLKATEKQAPKRCDCTLQRELVGDGIDVSTRMQIYT